jgi:flagellar biosynthesis chaperone FliJ
MNKARIARIARLVALRQQQRRLQEAAHAVARRKLDLAEQQHERCVASCESLDRQHDDFLQGELDPAELELLGEARSFAGGKLKEAAVATTTASEEAEKSRESLLAAHRAHRSLEMYHGRMTTLHLREVARNEQKDLDELALRGANAWRML